MELTYTKVGDYYFPNLVLDDDTEYEIGRYGQMLLKYLREHRPILWSQFVLTGKPWKHLAEIDSDCNERMDCIISAMKEREGVTEALKAEDQMERVRRMNSIRNRAEEIVLADLVLQIIPPDQFNRVEQARGRRTFEYEQKCSAAHEEYEEEVTLEDGSEVTVSRPPRSVPRKNVGKALLSGNVYCGHCGGRIFATTARKSHHQTTPETYERIPIYKCYNRTQHKERCDGPSTYRTQKIDAVIEELLRGIFQKAKYVKQNDVIQKQLSRSKTDYQKQIKITKSELSKGLKELGKWENLMLDSIEGNCAFSPAQVRKRMDAVQESVDELTKNRMRCKAKRIRLSLWQRNSRSSINSFCHGQMFLALPVWRKKR